jgi:glycosyltransferase involved in cell wall biosynthesis
MLSIVTPSFRQLPWLKLCTASIADQPEVEFEHIVQDAGSGQELEAWASTQPQLCLVTEKDQGMYDAVNRGFKKCKGEICAYLNCDEQYLPETLARVQRLFHARPEVDVLFGHALVVDGDGHYICTRHALVPTRYHSMVCNNLAILTCATFFRRRLLDVLGLFFDTHWRDLGDTIWVLELLQRRVRMELCGFPTSTFTDTGNNMNLQPNALAEKRRVFEMAPGWARACRKWIMVSYRLRKLLRGYYFPRPLTYSIYTRQSPAKRVRFEVARSTAVWRARLANPLPAAP